MNSILDAGEYPYFKNLKIFGFEKKVLKILISDNKDNISGHKATNIIDFGSFSFDENGKVLTIKDLLLPITQQISYKLILVTNQKWVEPSYLKNKFSDKEGYYNTFINNLHSINNKEYFRRKIEEDINENVLYKNHLELTRPNALNITYSKDFKTILSKAVEFFPKYYNKTYADTEIQRLRQLSIEEVTYFFTEYDIANSAEYWYIYYLLANVALKGKIAASGKSLPWQLDLMHISAANLYEFQEDEFYIYLRQKEEKILKKFFTCRKEVLFEIKNFEKEKNKTFILEIDVLKLEEKIDKNITLSDYHFTNDLFGFIEKTKFFNFVEKHFPKGVLAHSHFRALFTAGDILKSLDYSFKISTLYSQKSPALESQAFLYIELLEEDVINNGKFSDKKISRLFYLHNYFTIKEAALQSNLESIFLENFFIDKELSTCSIAAIRDKTIRISAEISAFFYLKYCRGTVLFTHNDIVKQDLKVLVASGFTELKDFSQLNALVERYSDVKYFHELLYKNSSALPKSHLAYINNAKDYYNNAIWYHLESLFVFYSHLFEIPFFLESLIKQFAQLCEETKIYAVDFRNNIDISKDFSIIKVLIKEFQAKQIPIAFILSAIKKAINNRFEGVILDFNSTSHNLTNISGMDFYGYEDNPFTGARNFFPIILQKMFKPNNKAEDIINELNQKELNQWEFDLLFRTLKSGKKLFLHAGETKYFPNYNVNEEFMSKFYINDNIIHAALLPNVERIGHGFSISNNDLIVSIFRKKNIALEICPVSNQILYYHKVNKNPFLKLLRNGIPIMISPDDPGLFGFRGVAQDWFHIILQTDIKPSELYMLLKYSVLKASKNIREEKGKILKKIVKDFKYFLKNINCININADSKLFETPGEVIDSMKRMSEKKNEFIRQIIDGDKKLNSLKEEVFIDIYDRHNFEGYIKTQN